jgi:hypothetical protein
MSVGGRVIEVVVDPKTGDLWVNTDDHGDLCAVYVKPQEPVRVGDALWWQGGWAFWTPQDRSRADVKIERTSYSGVSRPKGDRL